MTYTRHIRIEFNHCDPAGIVFYPRYFEMTNSVVENFFADVVGVYDVLGGSPDAAVQGAVQVPVNDPMMLIPAMASVTEHLGFGVTANLTYESPYLFSRRMSTLDHLTKGRIGWNIVTGYLDSAARAAGLSGQTAHDDRYDLADEYMALVYQLWEGSWEEGAVLADRQSGVYADASRVHLVKHKGPQYQVQAMHLAEPSPQRTPLLYQAGSSARGSRGEPGQAAGFQFSVNFRPLSAQSLR